MTLIKSQEESLISNESAVSLIKHRAKRACLKAVKQCRICTIMIGIKDKDVVKSIDYMNKTIAILNKKVVK